MRAKNSIKAGVERGTGQICIIHFHPHTQLESLSNTLTQGMLELHIKIGTV